jgi:NDP-sugar pyrophosphorylase family protein
MTGAPESLPLRGGIIAAGHGTRLRADGYRVSKPMTPVGGRPLIGHALDRFRAAGIREATVIINEGSDDCRQWLSGHAEGLDLDVIVRTTPSSYASFGLVAARLAGARAVITTVDAIMALDAFKHFVDSAARFPNEALVLGLTGHVDDDNPLWATLDEDGRIGRLGGDHGSHVTAGLYWLPAHLGPQPSARFDRLRDYLKWLVDERRPVYGVVLPLVFDIDRAHDVKAAEQAGLRPWPENAGA